MLRDCLRVGYRFVGFDPESGRARYTWIIKFLADAEG
jgi:hypothetical protein